MTPEKQFENKVKKFLKDEGCWFVKYWSGTSTNGKKFTKDGVPDLLVCVQGSFMAIELKSENGRPTELQLWNIEKIKEAGGYAFVLYPHQFEEFQRLIKLIKGRR